ncbi:MAG: OB-fold domain-containing protein [Gammaproteobacteria bacterium]|nr:OB-fold domain-containing protein [Gammaproteobacteria bacterium]
MSFEWQPASGRGTVYSYVVTHQPIHPSLVGHTPFLTVEIELEEGPRVISNLVDVESDDVQIGMAVEVVFHRLNDDVTLPLFQRRR